MKIEEYQETGIHHSFILPLFHNYFNTKYWSDIVFTAFSMKVDFFFFACLNSLQVQNLIN